MNGNFRAIHGWFATFKARHKLIPIKLTGESAIYSADEVSEKLNLNVRFNIVFVVK